MLHAPKRHWLGLSLDKRDDPLGFWVEENAEKQKFFLWFQKLLNLEKLLNV